MLRFDTGAPAGSGFIAKKPQKAKKIGGPAGLEGYRIVGRTPRLRAGRFQGWCATHGDQNLNLNLGCPPTATYSVHRVTTARFFQVFAELQNRERQPKKTEISPPLTKARGLSGTFGTHYLSAQDVHNSARSHKKPEKPQQNRSVQV